MIHPDRIKRILINNNITTEKVIDDIIADVKQKSANLLLSLVNQKIVSEQSLYEMLSKDYGVPFVDLRNSTIDQKLIDLLPESIVQTHEVVLFEHDTNTNTIKIATTDPDDLQTIDFVRKKTGATIQVYLTTQQSIDTIARQYQQHMAEEFAEFKQPLESGNELSATDISRDVPIIKIVDTLIDYAVFQNASDIHVEPTETSLIVRFRVDGVLKDVMTLPKSIQSGLTARLKILANLKLDEHRLPQDGRITISTDQVKVALRVSILPVYDGEKIVLRLLDESKNIMTLEQLGFNEVTLMVIKRHIKKPHGMILATGPTGSGKTTTLYTVLNILNTPQVNISTIEDPIEYRITRVNQSQINPKIGFTFATGLRTLLRQDPNIIMVGEIRDNETAQIASHAAMTGHLVLSTLHTNDAVSTVFRLSEMGIPHFLIASTVNVIIAQRLVRKICRDCIESYKLTKDNIEEISKQYDMKNVMDGFNILGETVESSTSIGELNFFKGVGCSKCGDTGYRGRVGIYEVFEMTEMASQAILDQVSKDDLEKIAIESGMITLAQDGFVKVKRGLTSIEEILRVTKE